MPNNPKAEVSQRARDAVQAFHRQVAAELMADLQSGEPFTFGDNNGSDGDAIHQTFARFEAEIRADLRQSTPAVVEALGDALHGLSAMMLVERAFETEAIHTAYERVVKAFAALNDAAHQPQTDPQGEAVREALRNEIINSPETADFMAGVPIEAIHQRERWGADHDAGKGPLDWFWLIGYLSQKAATSAIAGDTEKALHHTISTAAALANWHAALSGADNQMRPGIEPPAIRQQAAPGDGA